MSTTTNRLGLVNPVGTDSPAVIRTSLTANNAILDNAAIFDSGSLSARPITGSAPGTIYEATDVGIYYIYDGTNWFPVMIPGPWINAVAGGGWSTTSIANTSTAQSRQVGDRIELRGSVAATSPTPNATILTGLVPVSVGRFVSADHATSGPVHSFVALNASTTHLAYFASGVSIAVNDLISLDGISYSA